MKNDFTHSDERLQQKMEAFRMPAPEGAWDEIEKGLAEKNKWGRGFFLLLFTILFIGGAGIALMSFYGNNNDITDNHSPKALSMQNSQISAHSASTKQKVPASEKNGLNIEKENSNKNSDVRTVNYSSEGKTQTESSYPSSNMKKPDNTNPGGELTSKKAGTSTSQPKESGNNEAKTGNDDIASTSGGRVIKDPSFERNAQNAVKPETSLLLNAMTLKSPDFLSQHQYGLAPLSNNFDSNTTTRVKPEWSIELGAGISQFNYSANGTSADQQTFFRDSYTQNLGTNGFLRANIQPFSRWSFHTGVEFSQENAVQEYTETITNTTFQYDSIGAVFDSLNQVWVTIYDTVEVTSQIKQNYRAENNSSQIRIPFGVMFHIPVGLRSELGVNLSGLVGIRVRNSGSLLINNQGNSVVANDAYSRFNFGLRTALRYTYRLNERYSIYAEPYFGIGLNNQAGSSVPFEMRFNNSGIRVGLRRSF